MQPPTPPPGPPGGPPGQWQPHGPPGGPPSSSNATAAFILALLGFVAGLFPFVGLIGTIGLVLAIRELRRPPAEQTQRGLTIAATIFGALATAGVGLWLIAAVSIGASIAKGSCPHVYAFDGEGYRLDADPLSGALYAAAERDDLDRMESLRAVNGEYRLRVAAELEEVDHVDSLELQYVDHPAGVEVLPSQTGALYAVRDAQAPLRAADGAGEDVLPLLAADDGRTVTGAFPAQSDGDPRVVWTLEMERPKTDRALLVVRGHSTAFAEAAFGQYMATMGRGVRPLLEWAEGDACACSREYFDEEIERLGFPLWVRTSTSPAGPWTAAGALQPVGPAIARSQALPIDLPPGTGHVFVRLEATPEFWEIDHVALAPAPEASLAPHILHPRSAVLSSGADVTPLLSARDGKHVVLHRGEHVEVRFDAPAVEGGERTVVAAVRGYYEMDIGGKWGINPATMIGHRLGVVSLPRFAADLARKRAAR